MNNKEIKDPYGIENVCFSLVDEDDEHWEEYKQQRLEKGYDNTELWNLDATILKFILPRLKDFAVYHAGCPGELEDDSAWNAQIDKMIFWMENYLEDKQDDKIKEKMKEGKEAFFKYFEYLWD